MLWYRGSSYEGFAVVLDALVLKRLQNVIYSFDTVEDIAVEVGAYEMPEKWPMKQVNMRRI